MFTCIGRIGKIVTKLLNLRQALADLNITYVSPPAQTVAMTVSGNK